MPISCNTPTGEELVHAQRVMLENALMWASTNVRARESINLLALLAILSEQCWLLKHNDGRVTLEAGIGYSRRLTEREQFIIADFQNVGYLDVELHVTEAGAAVIEQHLMKDVRASERTCA